MDAVRSFFEKYNAVPADDRGPRWAEATTPALIGWLDQDVKLLPTLAGRDAAFVRVRLDEIVAEVWARVGRLYRECGGHPPGSPTHDEIGRLLAAVARNADRLTLVAKK